MKRLLLLLTLAATPVLSSCTDAWAVTMAPARPSTMIETVNGSPQFLGKIVATTTKNNHDTATPFNNTGTAMKAWALLVQCDAAAYILAGTTNAATVTTANGVLLEANEKFELTMLPAEGWLAALAVSGTANCRVWRKQ
jgi:hypothetical protein